MRFHRANDWPRYFDRCRRDLSSSSLGFLRRGEDEVTAGSLGTLDARDELAHVIGKIVERRGALGKDLVVEFLHVEFFLQLFGGGVTCLDYIELPNHVGGSLSRVALVACDLFAGEICGVPRIVIEILQSVVP